MRDHKEKHTEEMNKIQNEEVLEISQTGYGLESVTKGTDYMAGDKSDQPK